MYYDASDAQFLMGLVSGAFRHDPPTEGVGSYDITTDPDTGAQVLRVLFERENGVDLQGEWRLSLVSLTKTGEPEAEEVAGE